MVSVKKFSFKRILLIIITVIFVFCAVSMAATKIIYDAVFVRYDTPAEIPQALSATVQRRSLCQFPSGDVQLAGYYYNAENPSAAPGLMVIVPGFSAGGDDYLWQIQAFLDLGWGVFTYDNTGTLRSQGKNQVGFSQSVLDLEAALKYIETNGRFGYNDLVLLGHSRGAYAACCVLAEETEVSAVASVSGVNSAMDAIMQMSADVVGPVSYGNYGFLWLYQTLLFPGENWNLEASEAISHQNVPVLVIHGTLDDRIPADKCAISAHREQITDAPVEYYFCEAGHTDLLYDADGTANDKLTEKIHQFFLRSIGK